MFINQDIIGNIFKFLDIEYNQLFREVNKYFSLLFKYEKINWERFALRHSISLCKRHKIEINTKTFCKSAKQGNLEIMKWLEETGCRQVASRWTKSRNRTFVFKIRLEPKKQVCRWIKMTSSYAAQNGNLENMKWLQEKNYPLNKYTFIRAAKNGNLNNMKWLKENNCPWDNKTFVDAAKNGNLENMKWLMENNCPWDNQTFVTMAENGNLNNMKWLRGYNCPSDVLCFEAAALNGNLENMKWLKENNCPWDSRTFSNAATNGNLENMKWLKENNCPWDSRTFSNAAGGGCPFVHVVGLEQHHRMLGNLDNMEWLLENGCPWDANTFLYAVRDGNIKNIKWLYENKCPHKSEKELIIYEARDPIILTWLENFVFQDAENVDGNKKSGIESSSLLGKTEIVDNLTCWSFLKKICKKLT